MPNPVNPQHTRRVPLEFDDRGDPQFRTVCSPTDFKVHALGLLPPRHVIPVIFVPGIMGTNIRGAANAGPNKGKGAWTPPNGLGEGLGEVKHRLRQKPKDRQAQLNPDTTEVDPTGKVSVPAHLYNLTEDEAKKRGWGTVHYDSYGPILAYLEIALNDQYDNAGTAQATEMPVWTVAKTLKRTISHSGGGISDNNYPPEPDETVDVLKEWGQVKGETPPLTDAQFQKLDDYYYPVWACGYNWLKSNEESGKALAAFVGDVLKHYRESNWFIPEGRVIIVTHSMGGLVTRRAVQDVASDVLGVVHGVQPVTGAPVVYRRFRAGTEVGGFFDIPGAAAAVVLGWDAADITCVMANSPGPMELLPTKDYKPGWFNVEYEDGDGKRTSLLSGDFNPYGDPYEAIYSQRTQDVWWGMVDETLIDPAGSTNGKKDEGGDPQTPYGNFSDALNAAKKFHKAIGLTCHPNTYAYYGSDHEQVAFGSVHWVTRDKVSDEIKANLMSLKHKSVTSLGEVSVESDLLGKVKIKAGKHHMTFKLANRIKPKDDSDDNAGDGTVPNPSGSDITKTPAKSVYRLKGFDHQHSYDNERARENVLYCIARIIQDAKAAKDITK